MASLRRTLTEPADGPRASSALRPSHYRGLLSSLRRAPAHGIAAALSPVASAAESAASPFTIGALGEDGRRKYLHHHHPHESESALAPQHQQHDDGASRGRSSSVGVPGSRRRSLFGLRRNRSYSPAPRHPDEAPTDRSSIDIGRVEERSTGSKDPLDLTRTASASSAASDDGLLTAAGEPSHEGNVRHIADQNNGSSEQIPKDSERAKNQQDYLNPAHETGEDETGESLVGEDESDDESEWDIDPILLNNTIYNANYLELPASDSQTQYDSVDAGDDDHAGAPNVVLRDFCSQLDHSKHAASDTPPELGCNILHISKPIFERNRCTITITSGEWAEARSARARPKRYVVAADGSEEAAYAAEWTIGTVLRDGDEVLVVNVMETDVKFDEMDRKSDTTAARSEHQSIRASQARRLVGQCTRLLERTNLSVRISCQALHAKNARHMLLDLIDFFEPTMVIVGSRGLSSLKGILLGSTSHYLVQKSSVPVMVVRKRLTLPPLPKAKADVVAEVKSRHRELRDAAIEKESNATDQNPELAEVEEQEIKDEALKDHKPTESSTGPHIPHVPDVGGKKAATSAEERALAEMDRVREKEAQRELERERQRLVAQLAEEERERVRLEQAERALKRARAAGQPKETKEDAGNGVGEGSPKGLSRSESLCKSDSVPPSSLDKDPQAIDASRSAGPEIAHQPMPDLDKGAGDQRENQTKAAKTQGQALPATVSAPDSQFAPGSPSHVATSHTPASPAGAKRGPSPEADASQAKAP